VDEIGTHGTHSSGVPPANAGEVTNFIVGFSAAQAFTPGVRNRRRSEAPLMGRLKLISLFPKRNAWGYRKVIEIEGPPPGREYYITL
jgi:hypothetical protein